MSFGVQHLAERARRHRLVLVRLDGDESGFNPGAFRLGLRAKGQATPVAIGNADAVRRLLDALDKSGGVT